VLNPRSISEQTKACHILFHSIPPCLSWMSLPSNSFVVQHLIQFIFMFSILYMLCLSLIKILSSWHMQAQELSLNYYKIHKFFNQLHAKLFVSIIISITTPTGPAALPFSILYTSNIKQQKYHSAWSS